MELESSKKDNILFRELINTSSIEESNIFLELLWDKLEINGWQFQPCSIPQDNIVNIGINKIGSFSYTYKEKGKIQYLLIELSENSNITEKFLHKIVTECKASLHEPLLKFWIKIKISNKSSILIEPCSYKNISIIEENNTNYIIFGIDSKTRKGAKHKVFNIMVYLCNILLEYTNTIFDFNTNFIFLESTNTFEINIPQSYNYDWIELEELLINNKFILPKDFFIFINILLTSNSPCLLNKELGLLLNSSQILFSVTKLYHFCLDNSATLSVTVLDEILSSLAISSLEPLALIKNPNSERCKTCNNIKYSITQKIKELISFYYSDNAHILKLMTEKYKERSKLFHEGQTKVYDYYFVNSFPQLNSYNKTINLPHTAICDPFLLDLSSFIFRNITKEILEKIE